MYGKNVGLIYIIIFCFFKEFFSLNEVRGDENWKLWNLGVNNMNFCDYFVRSLVFFWKFFVVWNEKLWFINILIEIFGIFLNGK